MNEPTGRRDPWRSGNRPAWNQAQPYDNKTNQVCFHVGGVVRPSEARGGRAEPLFLPGIFGKGDGEIVANDRVLGVTNESGYFGGNVLALPVTDFSQAVSSQNKSNEAGRDHRNEMPRFTDYQAATAAIPARH
jgi:hypothetical protein